MVGNMLEYVGDVCMDLIADKEVCDLNSKAFTTCYKCPPSVRSKFRTFDGVGWGRVAGHITI